VFAALEAIFLALSWMLLRPWVLAATSGAGDLREWGSTLLSWLAALLAAAAGWIVAALVAPVLSAPALERIVTLVEAQIGAPPRASIGFFLELLCGLRATLLGIALIAPLELVTWLVALFFPPAATVITPIQFLLGAVAVAWSLFDYPLTLRGVSAGDRLGLMRRHARAVLGFGCAFALAFWLPCTGLVLLPIGVAAATQLLWQLDDPLLPNARSFQTRSRTVAIP
jgi:CysZ protein